MSKKYFVWKKPNCNGQNPEWIQMSGREFFSFIKHEENKHRRFIKLSSQTCFEVDIVYIESTENQYKQWIKEKNAHYHLSQINQSHQTVSMDYPIDDSSSYTVHEITADDSVNVENTVLKWCVNADLNQAISKLLPEQQEILEKFFFNKMSNQELARYYNVSCAAITQRIKRAINQLKKYL